MTKSVKLIGVIGTFVNGDCLSVVPLLKGSEDELSRDQDKGCKSRMSRRRDLGVVEGPPGISN